MPETASKMRPTDRSAIIDAYGGLLMVVEYGLHQIPDEIDREHLIRAHQILKTLLEKE